ncbi:UDP-glycosyltransferase 91A1-like [Vigna unguiculata]|uniref:Coniferyl-alcohol glucosyltransferase n=1 Tax=Vigna unguiculata TaxID=3917 RepID=A0A4D6L103_VIGUN|nr:UDP-glycosyltransferase 91A1-like [Vigna unguiculata]QCD81984.1 coniferyl-alcohol glucosyltransferase [Vigna unguiculata]
MSKDKEKVLHIVMFPWLAFGHMIPNLELAKLIAGKGHHVSFVSTPRNIERLPKVSQKLATLINFVKLPLPKVPNLPENAEATTDVPYDAVQYLKKAYDTLEEPFTRFLESSKADWLFYDFAPFWAAYVASKLGIRKAFYSICTPPFLGFLGPPSVLMGHDDSYRQKPEDFIVAPPWVPFPTTVAFRYFEIMRIVDSISSQNNSGVSDTYRFGAGIQNCDVMFIRGCTEFEPEWFHLLESIYQKPVLPVGQLPSTAPVGSEDNDTWRWMKDWLDKQARESVVYVAFGSEAKPTQDEVTEIALGLEKSKLPFLWLLRVQRGPCDPDVLRLPEGFEERIKGRGVVCSSWAPQLKILEHVAVGGFLTHSGWTSVVEAVQNEKPLVLLTFLADQGINARVLEEKKMGYSVPRDERDGSFSSDSVADSLKLVMGEEEGKIYRERIKEMKDLFVNGERQDRYIDNLIHNLKSLSKC